MSSGFPVDLILFAMIAVFLVLRLRSVLGRRDGYQRPPAAPVTPPLPGTPALAPRVPPVIEGQVVMPAEPARPLPAPSTPAGRGLAALAAADPAFDPARFLAGAESAFRIIVAAFAAGDRATLRPLLGEETFHAFDTAIGAREAAGEAQHTEIRAIPSAAIETAEQHGTNALITMRIVSDQVTNTRGRDGQIVAGTEAVTEIVDLWTFERALGTADPTWRLVAARSA